MKKPWYAINRLLIIGITALTVVVTYNATAGMAYKRKSLPIEKYKDEVKREELKDIASYFVNDWNYCADQLEFNEKGEIILPYKKKELIKRLRNEYKKLDDNSYFNKWKYL